MTNTMRSKDRFHPFIYELCSVVTSEQFDCVASLGFDPSNHVFETVSNLTLVFHEIW